MEKEILKILTQIRSEFDFSKELNFIDDEMLDSIDIIRLVSEIEIKFNISIDGSEIIPENFMTIDSIINLIKRKTHNL